MKGTCSSRQVLRYLGEEYVLDGPCASEGWKRTVGLAVTDHLAASSIWQMGCRQMPNGKLLEVWE